MSKLDTVLVAVSCWLAIASGVARSAVPPSPSPSAQSHYERPSTKGGPYKQRVIVFVHGLFGDADDTWRYSRNVYWPKLLLADDAFRDWDVYVAGYPTHYSGTMSLDDVVSNLNSRLVSDEVFSKHSEIVFVCHSLGGLVVQRMLLNHRRYATQVPFIYFFSTPETGAEIAKLASVFNADPLLKILLPGDGNAYLQSLETDWKASDFHIRRICAYETKKTKGVLVVDRLSSTRNCDGATAIDEDHIGIAKPNSANHDSYIALANAVRDYSATHSQALPAKPTVHKAEKKLLWESTGDAIIDAVQNRLNYLSPIPTDTELIDILRRLFEQPVFFSVDEELPETALYRFCRSSEILNYYAGTFSNPKIRAASIYSTEKLIYLQDIVGELYGLAFSAQIHCKAYRHNQKLYVDKLPSRMNRRYSVPDRASKALADLRESLQSVGLMDPAPTSSTEAQEVPRANATKPPSEPQSSQPPEVVPTPPAAPGILEASAMTDAPVEYYPEPPVTTPAVPNACTPKGKAYPVSKFSRMPGGPSSERPYFLPLPQRFAVRSKSTSKGEDETYDFFVEVVVTSRGESSIAKDWLLCLEYEGSPQWFRPEQLSQQDLSQLQVLSQLQDGASLTDVTLQSPVEHGHAAKGWLWFRVPKEILSSQKVLTGSIECRDYLEHRSVMSFGSSQSPSTKSTQQTQSLAAQRSPSAPVKPRNNLPTSLLDRLIEANKHLTEGDRDRLATALFKFSQVLDQANVLWGKAAREFGLLGSDWNNGSMAQDFESHRTTLGELDSQAKGFRDSYRKIREECSYYQEQTSYIFGDNENEGPNALINAIEGYANLLDQWSQIENKEQKQLQPLIAGSQTQFNEYSTTFAHWKQACDQRLVEMKKSIQ